MKILSPLQQVRFQSLISKTHLMFCLTLFPRWRILSTKALKTKGPRIRKRVPAEHLKVRRLLKDHDHPDGSQDADQDLGLQNDNGDQSQPPALEIAPKRGLINRKREVDQGQRDATIGPGLILSEEANIQDPGRAPGELDQGLL